MYIIKLVYAFDTTSRDRFDRSMIGWSVGWLCSRPFIFGGLASYLVTVVVVLLYFVLNSLYWQINLQFDYLKTTHEKIFYDDASRIKF